MPLLPAPALPVDQFECFLKFAAETARDGWEAGRKPRKGAAVRWTVERANAVATSVLQMLGAPVGLVGGYDAFDGLRRALSLYGSEQWDVMTARALRLQEQPDPSGFNFALDSKTRCIDRANLFPEAAAGIRELNIWLGAALAAYAASRRVAGDAAQVDQLQPTPPKPEPQPVAKRNKGGRPLDTAVLTRMRGALKLRDGEWQLVKNGQVVARKNYRDEYGKSIRTIDSYLKLLRSDMQQLD